VAKHDAPVAAVVSCGFELHHRIRAFLCFGIELPQGYLGSIVYGIVVLLQDSVVVSVASRNNVIFSFTSVFDPPLVVRLVGERTGGDLGPVEDASAFEVQETARLVLDREALAFVGLDQVGRVQARRAQSPVASRSWRLLPLGDLPGGFVEVNHALGVRGPAGHAALFVEGEVVISVEFRHLVETDLGVLEGFVLLDQGDGVPVLFEVLAQMEQLRVFGVDGGHEVEVTFLFGRFEEPFEGDVVLFFLFGLDGKRSEVLFR